MKGKCSKCEKLTKNCLCKGNYRESNWNNGQCFTCSRKVAICNCTYDINEDPCSKCNKNASDCLCSKAPGEVNWKNGDCSKCKNRCNKCVCQGDMREDNWSNGR